MPVSLVSTGVQFPDNTIQTTAASGGVPSSYSAVGSLALASFTTFFGGVYFPGDTFTGSQLRYAGIQGVAGTAGLSSAYDGGPNNNGLVAVGTWRLLSYGDRGSSQTWIGIFQRIS